MAANDLWLAKPVPRYTSYPPAPTFHVGVTADDYADSLAALAPDATISIYIHIPFCKQLCLFCGCHTTATHKNERVNLYVEALKRELKLLAPLAPRRVSHLHLGGGTPNILTEAAMDDLFSTLAANFDFSACREIAMEIDARIITRNQVQQMASLGVTRVSMGVQDFQTDVQQAVKREHSYALIEQVYDWLRAVGVQGINFDLMYGLPLQTPTSVADTARQVSLLAPDRVALFSYAHVPQLKRHQQALEEYGLPDKHQLLAMDRAARDVLVGGGYAELGMDHFALMDDSLTKAFHERRLRRNFQGYTDDTSEALLGVGASSIGETYNGYFQNERDTVTYQDILQQGRLPIMRGILRTDADRLRGAIIEELMCYLACDIEAICRHYGTTPEIFAAEFEALKPFENAGIITRDGYTIRLATPHRMAIRVISHVFDRYAATNGKPAVASSAA